jgi:hypothetical protein
MVKKLLLAPLLSCAALMIASTATMAVPLGGGIAGGLNETAPDVMIQKAWHSGMPHRRIVGDRVYGGRCPPQGCPAWSQRDLTQDPYSGEWYSPRNEAQRERDARRRGRGGYYPY